MFVRKVRAVELTADGRILQAAVSSGFHTMAAAIAQLRQPGRATVTLSTTPAFAAKWLVPKLGAFQAAHPDVDLHVHASNAPVDLKAGTVDLAIRYGEGHYPGLTATLLLEDQFAPVVSPTIAPMARRDVSQWSLIHFDWHRPPRVALGWDAWARAAGRQPSELPGGGVRYSEESHAIQAAVAGQGIALVSLLLVEEELRLGLLQVAAEPVLPALSYHLLKSSHHPPSEAVSVVESWLKRISGTTA